MSAAPVRSRRFLGRNNSFGMRQTIYQCTDALEIDQFEGYDVETKRVFFNDVLYITMHRQYSRWGLWLMGISTALGLLIALIASASSLEAGLVGLLGGVVPNLPFLAIFLRPYVHVTVFGKRTAASMSWHYRHAHAALVFAQLTTVVEQAQQRERQELDERTARVAAAMSSVPAEELAPPVPELELEPPPEAESL